MVQKIFESQVPVAFCSPNSQVKPCLGEVPEPATGPDRPSETAPVRPKATPASGKGFPPASGTFWLEENQRNILYFDIFRYILVCLDNVYCIFERYIDVKLFDRLVRTFTF